MPSEVRVHQLQETGKVPGSHWAFLPSLALPPSQNVLSRAKQEWTESNESLSSATEPEGGRMAGETQGTEGLLEMKQGVKVQSLAPEHETAAVGEQR